MKTTKFIALFLAVGSLAHAQSSLTAPTSRSAQQIIQDNAAAQAANRATSASGMQGGASYQQDVAGIIDDRTAAFKAWAAKNPSRANDLNAFMQFQDSLTMNEALALNRITLSDKQKSLVATADVLTAQGVPLQKQIDMAYAAGVSQRDVDMALTVTRLHSRADQYPSGYTGIIDNTGRNMTVTDVKELLALPQNGVGPGSFSYAIGPYGLNLNQEQGAHIMAIRFGAQYVSGAGLAKLDGKGVVDYAGNYTDPYYGSPAFTGSRNSDGTPYINAYGSETTKLGDWKKPANWGATPNDGSNGSFYSPVMNRFVTGEEVRAFFGTNPSKEIVAQVAKDLGINTEVQAKVLDYVGYGTVYSATLGRVISSDEVSGFFAGNPSDGQIRETAARLGISSADVASATSAMGR